MTCVHRWRLAETPQDRQFLAECVRCGDRTAFPVEPAWEYSAMGRTPTHVNGIPQFMQPFAWGSEGLVKGQRDRDITRTRKGNTTDDDSDY